MNPVYPAFAAILIMVLAYPLQQWMATGGYVYYANGFDEVAYLQYDFSVAAQGLSRPGQFLVTVLHHAGLSGGWINVVFDVLTLVLFPLLCRAIFRQLGWNPAQANMGALGMVVVPTLFLAANPLVHSLFTWNLSSGLVYWLNVPEAVMPSLLRTPEPQFSLMLLAAAVLAGLRLRVFWPVYLVLPFMYPFVAIPAAFTTLACHLRQRWPASAARFAIAGPPLLAFMAIGLAAWGFYTFLVSEKVRLIVVDSHLPLVSFTAVLALPLYAALRERIAEPYRFFALAIALSPLVASNQQLISGHIPQPDNFEQYAGCYAVTIVLLLALVQHVRWRMVVVALGFCLFARASYVSYRLNQIDEARLPMTPALATALREAPEHTVINDVMLASRLTLVHPRQRPTALSCEKTFTVLSEQYAPAYRCLKQQVLDEHPNDPGLRRAFRSLDKGFRFGSQDLPLIHINRKGTFKPLIDVEPTDCDERAERTLRYFFVGQGIMRKEPPKAALVAPPSQVPL